MAPSDDVRVWSVQLDQPTLAPGEVEALLSPDERERARRFALPVVARRFAAGRAVLRLILGQELGLDPAELTFSVGPHGKPALGSPAASRLEFNVSHSDERALVATARRRRLGVDLERRRPVPDAAAIAARFFSPAERAALEATPATERADAFLRCWTAKEAYLKARGDGLSCPLDGFDVAFDGDARLVACRFDPAEPTRWSLRRLDVGADYVATLAVEGDGWTLRQLTWPNGD